MVAVPVTSPPFVARVEQVTRADLRWSWHPGCPVAPSRLRRVRLSYVGFDGQTHQGELVVNQAVTQEVIEVFRRLYNVRFPIHSMQPVDVFHGSDERSMAADNTSSFNCRAAVTTGPKSWSMHAYGEAIDVNTVENPYIENGRVLPSSGAPFVDRTNVRPGMAIEGGPLVSSFGSAGWGWGGRWRGSPDYQHFSTNGR